MSAFARPRLPRGVLLVAGLLPALAAHAHVVLDSPTARAGTSYKAVLRVTHGCDGSPVREVVVQIPAGVRGARPMVKPGWRVESERVTLALPYTAHGRTVTQDVATVRFTGGVVPEGTVDEFVVFATLPETPGTLVWKVSQVCEQGRIDWAELPAAGSDAKPPKAPAPLLEVLPADPHAGHAH